VHLREANAHVRIIEEIRAKADNRSMVRATQLLHPQREPVATRPAATVLLLRDTPEGFEVLMTRRSDKASFAPGAYVFPGGVIDAGETPRAAAVRETLEELSLRITEDSLRVLANWVTDRDLPRRFDVTVFVARMPEGQEPVADEAEQFEPVWVRAGDALARHEAGKFFMIFPTIRTLQRLAKYASVQAVLDACESGKPLWTSCPRAGLLNGVDSRYMEHEMPFGELALVSPDGQLVHHLDWRADQAVPLLKNVTRVTAPNPGVMTGPGTNSYLVGDPHTGYIAIDPGPDDPEHIERIWRTAGGDIRIILCTHSHADHSPGARPLQQLCESKPPILGIASKPTARPASEFKPDREIADGEEVFVEGGGVRHTLRAVHTPGHAANHTCFILVEDALLFSGDHVLNGSTTVVDPPDGDMTDYLDSLDKLIRACDERGIEFILPAHGHVLGFAPLAIAHLKAHRLAREAKVMAAMRAKPSGSMEDWVRIAYDDVPPRMWPVAQRSLLAHVQRIEALGLVR
jgi:glyoxylase-like metal-dependent hydrolase (beta-lactamase superfamily II)/8-oxo-dGTP pyrophosphatase MutT (NUDIX family)